MSSRQQPRSQPGFKSPPEAPKKSCLSEIQRLQRDRDERRQRMGQAKQERAAEEQRNKDLGNPGDIDFQRMIRKYRGEQAPAEQPHKGPGESKICICVRKRPISTKEVKRNDYDSVTCKNPLVIVHDCKLKVDGISKYLDNNSFGFDHTFHEENTTDEIYHYAVQNLVDFVVGGGRATVFAYGQTGSGKTYTMQGIQSSMVDDLFDAIAAVPDRDILVYLSYFEIYGGRCQDLLNSRQRLNVREDGSGEVVVSDLMEMQAESPDALQAIIETGNRNRTTHATESNDESSRSHAICQIALRCISPKSGDEQLVGRLSLIDLAGSERGADTKSHNRQRRMEGAEINKSLLALKECIRALDSGSSHVPYRASKLTLVLKDSFTRPKSRTVMIANISPAASSADHTINTLRYADRIKEQRVSSAALAAAAPAPAPVPVPSSGSQKDRNTRNKEIQKVLADNISTAAAPKMPPSSSKSSAAAAAGAGAAGSKRGSADRETRDRASSRASVGSQQSGSERGRKESYSEQEEEEEEEGDFGDNGDDEDGDVDAFHQTVQDLFDEEEELLNLHMTVIQENAELLTEEGRLLQQIQGENNDIDAYAARLDKILQRKQEVIRTLRQKLDQFRRSLQREEKLSRKLAGQMPSY